MLLKGNDVEWISVEDRLPKYGNGGFLVYYKTQPPLMLICHMDIHNNYIISGCCGDTTGHGEYPKFSHWMPLPDKPQTEKESE